MAGPTPGLFHSDDDRPGASRIYEGPAMKR